MPETIGLNARSSSPSSLPWWISGLRPQARGKDWRAAVAHVLLYEMERLPGTDATVAAETGLGIQSSTYWYISRSEEMFGYVVFFWRATIEGWKESDGGCCPFDSGGLWHGHVRTVAPLSYSERRLLFAQHNRPLSGWSDTFRSYLATNYEDPRDYVRGLPPQEGASAILNQSPNSPQAWTWEARIRREVFGAERVQLERIYWQLPQLDNFLYWVEKESRYDDSVQERLAAWVLEISVDCPLAESPTQWATLDLLEHVRS